MLVMVADSNIVRAMSEDPAPPPGINDAGNDTAPPPVETPVPPPDAPQRDVEPGTITQGRADDIVSHIEDHSSPKLVESDSQLEYRTAYGVFFLSKDAPYFIGVSAAGYLYEAKVA